MRTNAPLLLVLLAVSASAAEVRYHAVPLVSMTPGGVNEPQGISENGIISGGSSFDAGGGYTAAVVWPYAGTDPIVIGGTPGSASFGSAVNSDGVVCGMLDSGTPFVWHDGVLTQLTAASGQPLAFGTPHAISDSGVVAGRAMGSGSPFDHAIAWNPPTGQRLPVPPGTAYAYAYGINESGRIVGSLVGPDLKSYLAIWELGQPMVMTVGSGTTFVRELLAVNNHGVCVGWVSAESSPGTWHGVRWNGTTLTTLAELPAPVGGNLVRAVDINDEGLIVGGDNRQALLWRSPTEVVALHSLVLDLPAGQDLDEAFAVNNAGQIIASGWPNAYLLQPYTCAGDANLDATVNAADLSVLLAKFGDSGAAWDRGDLNGDRHIDAADLSVLLGAFGGACP